MKPAEVMANRTARLMQADCSTTEKLSLLEELEDLLGDIDNARDYYQVGM
jgi:hypothetical protein